MEGRLVLPPEHAAGVYATAAGVWHTQYDFTIDFALPLVPESGDPDDGGAELEHRVVARVRVPVGFAFELIRFISATMESYETRWGEIHRPERRDRGQS